MFRITSGPSSGSFIQCLAKITVTVLSCPLTWTYSVLWQSAYLDSAVHTRTTAHSRLCSIHTHHGTL